MTPYQLTAAYSNIGGPACVTLCDGFPWHPKTTDTENNNLEQHWPVIQLCFRVFRNEARNPELNHPAGLFLRISGNPQVLSHRKIASDCEKERTPGAGWCPKLCPKPFRRIRVQPKEPEKATPRACPAT